METIKKILAEIDRQIKSLKVHLIENKESNYTKGCLDQATNIFSFIKSLEKEQEPEPKIKGWVARDRNKALFFHHEKPHRYYGDTWRTDWVMHPQPELHHLRLLDGIMPNLKWEDEPIEVELIIKRV